MAETDQPHAPEGALSKELLGGVISLCSFSDLHVRYSIGYLLQRVTPSIALNQYRYYESDDGRPVGFCSWACLSDARLEEAKSGALDFPLQEWRSGDNFFFVEMIAPFGHCRSIVRDLRENVVPKKLTAWSTRGEIVSQDKDREGRVQRFANR